MTQPAASTVSEQTALPSTYPKTSPKPRAPAAGAVTRSEERTTLCRRRIGLQGSPRQPCRGPETFASSQHEAITKRILTERLNVLRTWATGRERNALQPSN